MHISLSASPCINNNAKERRAREPFDLHRDRFAINDSFCRGRERGRKAVFAPFRAVYRRKAFRLHFCHKQHLEADTRRRGLSYHYNKVYCIFLSGKCWSSFTTLALGDMYKLRHRGRVFKRNMMMHDYKLCSCVCSKKEKRGQIRDQKILHHKWRQGILPPSLSLSFF